MTTVVDTTAAWAATLTQVVGVVVLWMRAMAQCRHEAQASPDRDARVT